MYEKGKTIHPHLYLSTSVFTCPSLSLVEPNKTQHKQLPLTKEYSRMVQNTEKQRWRCQAEEKQEAQCSQDEWAKILSNKRWGGEGTIEQKWGQEGMIRNFVFLSIILFLIIHPAFKASRIYRMLQSTESSHSVMKNHEPGTRPTCRDVRK